MTGKLVLYELKKSLKDRFVKVAAVVLLVISAVPFWLLGDYADAMRQNKAAGVQAISLPAYVRNVHDAGKERTEKSRIFTGLTALEREAFEDRMREKYGEDVFTSEFFIPQEGMTELPGVLGEKVSDLDAVYMVRDLMRENKEIQGDLESVIKSAKALGRDAVRNEDDYAVRRNLEIIELYSVKRKEARGIVLGWDRFLFSRQSAVCAFLLILLVSAGSFAREKDEGIRNFLMTTRNGRGRTAFAKCAACGITGGAAAFLCWLASLAGTGLTVGLCGHEESVCRLAELRYCPWPLTIGEYALIMLLCQMMAGAFVAILLAALSAVMPGGAESYAAGVLLLGVFLRLLYALPRREYLAGPASLADPRRFFASYYVANIFGYPVPWLLLQALLMTAACILFAYLGSSMFVRRLR